MTAIDNTSTTSQRRGCVGRLAESFWCFSDCPRCGARLDAEEICWDGGRYASATYFCACCGHRWSEDDWPLVLALGPNWWRREQPVHLVAGVDVRAYTGAQLQAWISALR
jgi:hypothetical protein